MCGEKSVTYTLLERCGGSPRVCGEKRGLAGGRTVEHGITPAYAGKSLLNRLNSSGVSDYPRMCGEKFLSGFL